MNYNNAVVWYCKCSSNILVTILHCSVNNKHTKHLFLNPFLVLKIFLKVILLIKSEKSELQYHPFSFI